ncbi:MAG: hypothetical protein F7C81_05820 [Desulfurococcales archaeon]|nr:hypothetical protein [Desulfurococcales archaeon]
MNRASRFDAELLLYIVFSIIGISTMVNAPGILYGYGLVFASALYAALRFTPLKASLSFGLSHLASVLILVSVKAVFTIVAVASLILRPLFVYPASVMARRGGPLQASLFLVVADALIALSIAILYYGDSGIHVGLTIYEVLLVPFVYLIARRVGEGDRVGAFIGVSALALYFLSVYAFISVIGVLFSIATILVYSYAGRASGWGLYVKIIGVIFVLAGFMLGGTPLKYNVEASLYPFNPKNWGDTRWAQEEPGLCPETINVFEDTYSPQRLRIIDSCETIVGVVRGPPTISGDGDYVFDLKLEDDYKHMLSLGNLILRSSTLHIEVVPADHDEVLKSIGGVCPGDKVRVTGVFVVDTDHGMWAEIHPAYRVDVIEASSNEVRWPDCVMGRMFEEGD